MQVTQRNYPAGDGRLKTTLARRSEEKEGVCSTVAKRVNLGQKCKHVSGLAGLGEHVFITAIGLNQRMFWLK